MNVPVVIPQLFYDAIARVIPGAVVLVLFEIYRSILLTSAEPEPELFSLVEALGRGVELAIIAYVIGWILNALAWPTFHPPRRPDEHSEQTSSKTKDGELSSRDKYQWIRLAHPEAGYRIVKLRAEAKMLESVRAAFVLSSIAAIVLLIIAFFDFVELKSDASNWHLVFLLAVSFASALLIYKRLEREAWDRYTGNIVSIYQLLHDEQNPIPLTSSSRWPLKTSDSPGDREKRE